MSGPYVIVNLYAEQAWHEDLKLKEFASATEAAAYKHNALVCLRAEGSDMDDDESAIMPLAQYLVEYGQ